MAELDPELREFHARTSADYVRFGAAAPAGVAGRRAVAERVREPWRAGGPVMAETRDLTAGEGGVRLRLHRPTTRAPLPVLVYLHGGGWTLFSVDSHDRLMREYAARSGCAVVGVDYSLSPEARYPQALEEIVDACAWLRTQEAALGLDPARLALGGDSAGANLALASAMRLRDTGRPTAGVLLNYGAFDTEHRASHDLYGDPDRYMLSAPEMTEFWANYLGAADAAAEDLLARPLRADLHGLPPAFLCIAQCDVLLDENLEMAERLRRAGVEVEAEVYAGACHSFLEAVEISTLARKGLEDGAGWLRRHLRP